MLESHYLSESEKPKIPDVLSKTVKLKKISALPKLDPSKIKKIGKISMGKITIKRSSTKVKKLRVKQPEKKKLYGIDAEFFNTVHMKEDHHSMAQASISEEMKEVSKDDHHLSQLNGKLGRKSKLREVCNEFRSN